VCANTHRNTRVSVNAHTGTHMRTHIAVYVCAACIHTCTPCIHSVRVHAWRMCKGGFDNLVYI
jgi:ribonucleotide reductase alpha subunit